MNRRGPKNLPASIQARLLNISRQQSIPHQRLLTQYAAERLLYRISRSEYRDRFCLKGAMLFLLWLPSSPRPTRDLDLLGAGLSAAGGVEQAFRQVCETQVEEDGLEFHTESLVAEDIRDDADYGGIRIGLLATLGNAQIRLHIDVGVGDAVTPQAQEEDFPVLLDQPAPRILVYPRETVVAEKLQAMVAMGFPNSRMKDFYDIWILAERFDFDGLILSRAIKATFRRRQTPLPQTTPVALTPEFGGDAGKEAQWTGFLYRAELEGPGLPEVVSDLRSFLWAPMEALVLVQPFKQVWRHGDRWVGSGRQ